MLCLRGSATDTVVGLRAPQHPSWETLGHSLADSCGGSHRIAGPRAPRRHDPPLGLAENTEDLEQKYTLFIKYYHNILSSGHCIVLFSIEIQRATCSVRIICKTSPLGSFYN